MERRLDSDLFSLSYCSDLNYLYLCWKRQPLPGTGEYRSVMLEAMDALMRYKPLYSVTDICHQGLVSPQDRKWWEDEVLPIVMKSSLRMAFMVCDGNSFHKYYVYKLQTAFQRRNMEMVTAASLNEVLTYITKRHKPFSLR